MASSASRKLCAYDNECKQMAAALCEGCSRALCSKHFIDHRRLLGEEMNVIISEYDELQDTLDQQTVNADWHPLFDQINEWERESIAEIRQKAKELRQELLQLTTVHLDGLSKKLRDLSEKLKEGHEHESFVDTDIHIWKKGLDDLKANLTPPSTFSWVENRSELFERALENIVRIEENGQVVSHATVSGYVEIRGRNEYKSGCHEIRLLIEESADSWMFLGINSQSIPLQYKSFYSKSAYGWSTDNYFWLNGRKYSNTSTFSIEMKTDDTISLKFDCDKHKIFMINERTNAKYELDVNIRYCRFPWQLHVVLLNGNSRMRILPTSS